MVNRARENRNEPRETVGEYYSVEFSLKGMEIIHQFKIWNMSSQGMCVVVGKNSEVLKYLKVGDTVDLKYYSADASWPAKYLKTEIKHITKEESGMFRDHILVGLYIIK